MAIKVSYTLYLMIILVFFACGSSDDNDTSGNSNTGGQTSRVQPAQDWSVDDFTYVYEVGPGLEYETPADVPWQNLLPSTIVRIHFRPEPYRTKFAITTSASEENPIVVIGIADNGNLPVISGEDATTNASFNYLNQDRSVIKIGNYNGDSDTDIPSYVYLENLDIQNGRPSYQFANSDGSSTDYRGNAAAVHVEEGDHITIRGCNIHDCANGVFTTHLTGNVVISGNFIYDNGMEGRIYEHNTYTESFGITYEYNHFGPLRTGCSGNNLKDRSTGTTIRYNWIEGGNRQLDLVDSDYADFYLDTSYETTFVYGNILIEPDGAGNSQIIHYGGDSGETERYRTGVLYLYNNTIISKRSGNTTLIRLSTENVTADIRNNIIYTTAPPGRLALTNGQGIIKLSYNWLTENYQDSFESTSPDIQVNTGNIEGTVPGFANFSSDNFSLNEDSDCSTAAGENAAGASYYPVDQEYVVHQSIKERSDAGNLSAIGAFSKDL